jgi:hypothetical protein
MVVHEFAYEELNGMSFHLVPAARMVSLGGHRPRSNGPRSKT